MTEEDIASERVRSAKFHAQAHAIAASLDPPAEIATVQFVSFALRSYWEA